MQAEMSVQVDHIGLRDGDARALAIVQRVPVRHDHVEPVYGAALEEADEGRTVGRSDSRTV